MILNSVFLSFQTTKWSAISIHYELKTGSFLLFFPLLRWLAIAIFDATYTANSAAFLTINKYDHPIKTVEDLANQNKIRFGTAPGQLANMLE